MSETSDNLPAEPVLEAMPEDAGAAPFMGAADVGEELAAALAEAARNREAYLRVMADFDNYRRRAVRERDEAKAQAVGGLLEDFLPVFDGLALAVESTGGAGDAATIAKGVAMITGQFSEVLSRHGVERIDPAGAAFDPNDHEAVSHAPSGEVAEGHVMQVIRPGYRIGRRLVRAASVVVSSGNPQKNS